MNIYPFHRVLYRESEDGPWLMLDLKLYIYEDAEWNAISLLQTKKAIEVKVMEINDSHERQVFFKESEEWRKEIERRQKIEMEKEIDNSYDVGIGF